MEIGTKFIGLKVIVRCVDSGVLYGTLVAKEGKQVELANARKIYYWEGACAVEQMAVDGFAKPNACKLTVSVAEMIVDDACQVLKCTDKAIECIEKISPWKS